MKSVAIVIPCRNEEQYIGKCIDSILQQDYPAEKISVFICDGKSTDRTLEVVYEYTCQHKNIRLLINERQSTPFALNLGIENAASDVVIILGAHAELYPDYVSACINAFNVDAAVGCTGGVIENVYENKAAEAIGKAMSSSFGVGNAHFRTGSKDGFVDTVAFGAYKKEVFEKIGLFDEELIRNQDDEFNYRVIKAGFKIYLTAKIRSKYFVRGSYKKLFKQYYQYGYWKVYVGKKHTAVTTVRQLVPLLFVLFLFLMPFMSLLSENFLAACLGILSLYGISSFCFSIKISDRIKQAGNIMRSFFILHFSYGLGYLKGIFDFFIMRKKIKIVESLTR